MNDVSKRACASGSAHHPRLPLGIATALLVVFTCAATAHAADKECVARKLRAAGNGVVGILACHREAAKDAPEELPACLDGVVATALAALAAAEARGGCEGTNPPDLAWKRARQMGLSTATRLAGFYSGDDLVEVLENERAAWVRFLRFVLHQTRDPDPDGMDIAIFKKWGLPPGARLNRVIRLRGRIAPVCGDDVRAPAEECDGRDDEACPFSCRRFCTCPP